MSESEPLSAERDPWLADIVRCGELALAKWQEAHLNEETLALTFVGPDGPFYEGIRSVVERLRDYHFERTRAALRSTDDEVVALDAQLAAIGRVAVGVVNDWIGDPDHGFILDRLVAPVEAWRAALSQNPEPTPREVDVPGAAAALGLTEEQVRNLMDAGVLKPIPGFVAPDPEP